MVNTKRKLLLQKNPHKDVIIRAVGAAAVARTYYVARRSILWNMYAARHTDTVRVVRVRNVQF